MRFITVFFCIFLIFGSASAAFAAPAKPSDSGSAAPAKASKPAAGKTAAKPSAKTSPSAKAPAPKPSKAQAALSGLKKDLDSLCEDEKRGGLRENWLHLEDRFIALSGESSGKVRAEADFYRARTHEELSRRSFNPADCREAARLYGVVARTHARYAVAPESLYRRAAILAQRLDEPDHARAAAALLLKSYPKSDEAGAARKLLGELDSAAKSADASGAKAARAGGGSPDGRDVAETAVKREAAGKSVPAVNLKKISWKGKESRATISLELDGGTDYSYEFVPGDPAKNTPARLYLDIPGALPAPGVKPGLAPKGLAVTRIRTGHSGGGTRIMFDCDGARCYIVNTAPGEPGTIRVEISRNNDIKGGITVMAPGGGKESRQAPAPREAGRGLASLGAGKGSGKSPGSLMEQLGLTVQTIMLDPGHGGKDPGAMTGGLVERDFTLAMSRRVGTLLRKKGFTVLYTRNSDTFITLQDRPDRANSRKADLFLSLHMNSNNNPAVKGLEIYYLDMAKSADAAKVAARENAVSVKNISDLQYILTDLMLSAKLEESHDLAGCVREGILQSLREAKLPAVDHGVRSAPFYVLMGARMPAVLIEFGYASNPEEAAHLRSERFLQRQAEGVVDGIMAYKAKLAKFAPPK